MSTSSNVNALTIPDTKPILGDLPVHDVKPGAVYCVHTQNHLNLIRACAALLVLVSHSYTLATGDPKNEPWQDAFGISPGGIAVYAFFGISGYLLTGSINRTRSPWIFILSRVVRIYPALIAAVILSVLVIGLNFTTLTPKEYFLSPQTWNYLIKNIVMILWGEGNLPGAFEENPFPNAVNGSLWTLRYELRLYLALCFIWYIFRLAKNNSYASLRERTLLGIAAILLISTALFSLALIPLTPGLQLSASFFSGSACWILSRGGLKLPTPRWAILFSVPMVAMSWQHHSLFVVLLCLCLPWVIMALAHAKCQWLLNFNRLGDYSYGIYLYAFPVQQALMSLSPALTVWELTAAASVITVALAIASWHLLEKPSISRSRSLAHGVHP